MSILSSIENSFESYQKLIAFYDTNKDKLFDNVAIELRHWFSANMSAALGAVLDKFTANLNYIHFEHIDPRIETILLKNDFLTYFGKSRAIDIHNTTIKFQKLQPKDGKFFKNYVINELIEGHTTDLPRMTTGVKEKIVEAIYEIFVNAQIHSETQHIYTCGQFYPQKNKIEFTIVDTGLGFREKINRRFESSLSSIQALKWAVQDKKTTKVGVSGGIGLAVLKEFVRMNRGKMQIISNDGFYQYDGISEVLQVFTGEFPGTIVNLQFRTDDSKNYLLQSEIDVNDIF
jgi:signal transduction histidine kinase